MGRTSMRLTALLTTSLVACAGNGAGSGGGGIEPLPELPQLLVNDVFVLFNVIPKGGSHRRDILLFNGGQQDLVIGAVSLVGDPAGAFALANTPLTDVTVASGESLAVGITFQPAVRGVFLAGLAITSNAENLATTELELIGPAGSSPLASGPDLLAFEDPVTVVADLNVAFVRFVNVGGRSAALADYAIAPTGERFRLLTGTAQPTVDDPIALPAGATVIISLGYNASLAGATTALFTLTHYDFNDVQFIGGVRTVDPGVLVQQNVTVDAP